MDYFIKQRLDRIEQNALYMVQTGQQVRIQRN